jgi:hypothetical protein
MTSALEEGEWSEARPSRTLHPGKTRYPFYRRLGGPQGQSGQARKTSPLQEFDPGPSSPWIVAILTELPGPQKLAYINVKFQEAMSFWQPASRSAAHEIPLLLRKPKFHWQHLKISTIHHLFFLHIYILRTLM